MIKVASFVSFFSGNFLKGRYYSRFFVIDVKSMLFIVGFRTNLPIKFKDALARK